MGGQAQAEAVALRALAWIAADAGRAAAFLAATGAAPADLRAAAETGDAAFLAGVLDHLLGDERAVRAFAAGTGLPPGAALAARAALAGGGVPHWT